MDRLFTLFRPDLLLFLQLFSFCSEFDGHFTNYYEGNKFNLNNKTTYYKASRDVSSAESGSATPLFEDEDDLYDTLDSLDCSVPDNEPSSFHPDHSSVFLSPPCSDTTFLSPSDTVSVACRRSSIICVRKGRGQESHHQQGRNDLPQLSS